MPDTPDAAAAELVATVPAIMCALRAAVRDSESGMLPEQMRTLSVLSYGATTPGAIAALFDVALPTVSKTLAALERRGWVERTADTEDRRRVLVRLTGNGRAAHAATRAAVEARFAEALSVLSAEEIATVRSAFSLLEDALGSAELMPR